LDCGALPCGAFFFSIQNKEKAPARFGSRGLNSIALKGELGISATDVNVGRATLHSNWSRALRFRHAKISTNEGHTAVSPLGYRLDDNCTLVVAVKGPAREPLYWLSYRDDDAVAIVLQPRIFCSCAPLPIASSLHASFIPIPGFADFFASLHLSAKLGHLRGGGAAADAG
jgi:hypothetical protein